jgi:hypothetical protein
VVALAIRRLSQQLANKEFTLARGAHLACD